MAERTSRPSGPAGRRGLDDARVRGSTPICRAMVVVALTVAGCSALDDWHGGIGAVLTYSGEGVLHVTEAPADGAAARAGLAVDDVVVAIDGQAVEGMDREQVVTALRGRVGSRVRLRVRRGLDVREVTVERAPYHARRR